MAKKITEEQVRQVAKLSRLKLDDEHITLFTGQMGAILEYIEKLNELDTTDVEPLAHCLPISNVTRADIPKASLGTETVLKTAPQKDGDYFKVPKILEDTSA